MTFGALVEKKNLIPSIPTQKRPEYFHVPNVKLDAFSRQVGSSSNMNNSACT